MNAFFSFISNEWTQDFYPWKLHQLNLRFIYFVFVVLKLFMSCFSRVFLPFIFLSHIILINNFFKSHHKRTVWETCFPDSTLFVSHFNFVFPSVYFLPITSYTSFPFCCLPERIMIEIINFPVISCLKRVKSRVQVQDIIFNVWASLTIQHVLWEIFKSCLESNYST